VKLVGSRLSEDLDPAKAEAVILRRERILVDSNLAYGFFRRKLPSAEAIDEDGATARSSRRSGERLQICLQIFGIVGEGLEVTTSQDNRTGIVGRLEAYGWSAVVLYRDLLL